MAEIRIVTPSDYIQHGYELRATCHKCQKTVVIDLHALVQRGMGDRGIRSLRPWCSHCGVHGGWLVFPPSRHRS